ncbi:branched-chain amino acid aminotransferase [Subtercola boreus]|uniref:Branched-chain amino acid aminotransferase n=1 Tax=Subtercola boreus TaxID=120213 RepID=A0A3E0VLS9_9MICO|nr:DUF429 domain-containing protein [Subtercola boreus]RFA10934.1 branched-chain amino acid aminotransferase [Subtercola boreus]TQL55472.1 uncharacterized protein DUF429 [Subtercola boreus]
MITAGVDLAAEPKGTALAVIEWGEAPRGGGGGGLARATLTSLTLGVADELIADTAERVDKLGIDCALGWPDEFVQFVVAHHGGETFDPAVDGGIDWRRTLAYRETDRVVQERTGRWPLSVSTDRLGLTAMRAAGLLARIAERGIAVDRSGAGLVVEIYPVASLRLWGLVTTGYRADVARRAELIDDLLAAAPWFDVRGFRSLMLGSTDAFDAVVAALATRSAAIGLADEPGERMLARARREGWVALPTGSLQSLVEPG